jgi:hypothetical protein
MYGWMRRQEEQGMEPIRITITGSVARIEGYPDAAKVIMVTGANCRNLADLSLHDADLQFALESLDALNEEGMPSHVRESLWRSAIVHFFKCFQHSKSRKLLDGKTIYASAAPEVTANFEFLKKLRNKHLVHDENPFAQCAIGAILNNGKKDLKIARVFAANFFLATLNPDRVSQLHSMALDALAYVRREMDLLIEQITQELEAKKYEELLAMPQLSQTAPTLDAAGKPR